MSTKPTTLPAWNTGGANRAAPSAGQEIAGFANGDQAPSSWFNYFLYWVFTWLQYLSDGAFTSSTGDAASGTSTHTGSAGLRGTNAGAGGMGVWGTGGSGGGAAGVYGNSTGAGVPGVSGYATNSSAPGVLGESTGAGAPGVHGISALDVGGRFAGVSTVLPAIDVIGNVDFSSAGVPAANATLPNQLTRMNFAKAQGLVTFNNTASPTTSGVQNATITGSATGDATVTFAQAMASSTYQIHATVEHIVGSFPLAISVTSKSASAFTFFLYKMTVSGSDIVLGSAPTGAEANGVRVAFTVMGDQ